MYRSFSLSPSYDEQPVLVTSHDDHLVTSHDDHLVTSHDDHLVTSHDDHLVTSQDDHLVTSHDDQLVMTSNPTGGVLGRRRTVPEIGRARPVATRVNNVIAWLRARRRPSSCDDHPTET